MNLIEKFKTVHGERYDYSKVKANQLRDRIIVGCPIHGEWSCIANSHLQGHGCRKCSADTRRVSFDEYVVRARKAHGERYQYDRTSYAWNKPSRIECPIHGSFFQRPNAHCRGAKCPRCAGKESTSTDSFIVKARLVHGDKYAYRGTEYVKSSEKVTITCPLHGEFHQTPNIHLRGSGCPQCAGKESTNTCSFITKARLVHENRYTYEKTFYERNNRKVIITCPIHGDFSQTPNSHLNGNGCSVCTGRVVVDTPSFIQKSTQVHGETYDYSKVRYTGSTTPVVISCPKHGDFAQSPDHHVRPQGCPSCGVSLSKGETEVGDFLESLGEQVERRRRDLIVPMELDLFLPEKRVAVEYCGLYWHSESGGKYRHYHKRKLERCEENGISLITLYEDEWRTKRPIVESILRHKINHGESGIGARSLKISPVSATECSRFLEQYHLRGAVRGRSEAIGAYDETSLVSVMTFSPSRNNTELELSRFCSDNRRHPGIASRLFSSYIKMRHPDRVISFSDRRWYDGTVYERLGFKQDKELAPDYEYVWKNSRFHKSTFRKEKLMKRFGLTGTEREMTQQIGAERIYDCGKTRWVWENKNVTT